MIIAEPAQLLAALANQQHLLQKILSALDKPKLGFHDDAGTIYVYCNRQHNCNWYTLDGDRTPAPIAHSAISGYLRQLKFAKTERRGKGCYKLLVTIEADRGYVLESGHDTQFSKSLLAAVATLTPQQMLEPLTFQPVAGDDDSVLFCRLWVGPELAKAAYDNTTNWREKAKRAIANVRAAAEAAPF